jgi:hypothetical protein
MGAGDLTPACRGRLILRRRTRAAGPVTRKILSPYRHHRPDCPRFFPLSFPAAILAPSDHRFAVESRSGDSYTYRNLAGKGTPERRRAGPGGQ